MLDEQRYDFDRVFRLLISAATILLLFFLLRYLSEVLIPFVIAFCWRTCFTPWSAGSSGASGIVPLPCC
jgi:predicted PurR-regulated permease PerM